MARLNLFDSKERFVCIVHSFVGAFNKFLTPTNFVIRLKADRTVLVHCSFGLQGEREDCRSADGSEFYLTPTNLQEPQLKPLS